VTHPKRKATTRSTSSNSWSGVLELGPRDRLGQVHTEEGLAGSKSASQPIAGRDRRVVDRNREGIIQAGLAVARSSLSVSSNLPRPTLKEKVAKVRPADERGTQCTDNLTGSSWTDRKGLTSNCKCAKRNKMRQLGRHQRSGIVSTVGRSVEVSPASEA